MDILQDIKAKLASLSESEAELLANQRENEARLKEIRIKQSVYQELLGTYLRGAPSFGTDYRLREPMRAPIEPTYAPQSGMPSYGSQGMSQTPSYATQQEQTQRSYQPQAQMQPSYMTQQSQVQPYPQQQSLPQQHPYIRPDNAQQVYGQPTYTQQQPQPQVHTSQQTYVPVSSVPAEAKSRPSTPKRQVSSASAGSAKRLSSQTTAEIWMTVKDILSDGSSWQVGDLRHEVESRMSIGEVNRTTLQSILKRNEASLDRREKGYVKLY